MNVGKIIKRAIQVLAGLGLCLMFGFPLANAWFEAHPDESKVLLGAAAQVDPEADTLTKAGQFVGNLGKNREEVTVEKRAEANQKANEEAERKQDELRKFNTGELESD